MGKSGSQNLANRRLWISIQVMMVVVSLWLKPAQCLECRIQRCNAEFVASTAPPGGGPQYCAALRGFSLCTRRTARGCRGDLVYHSAVFRIKELLAQHNCSSEGPTAAPRGPSAPPRPCDYESGAPGPVRYVHCGLFGDPHLRTFGGELQTCRAEGAWPLLDNRYLSVQVTNVPVAPGSAATATSQVTLIFKASAGCSEARVYQASAEDLPAVFGDGTRSGGAGSSLRVSGGAGRVRVEARHAGTSVSVRRAGRYLGLAVRMPEAALGSSQDEGGLQLCLHGCPLSERVETPPPAPPHSPARTAEWASARCREALQVEDGYLRACVFDLLTTGDAQFTQAAQGALEDLQALPPTRLEHASPGAPPLHDTGAGAAPPSLLSLLTLLLLLLSE
ncbi:repulsive guidance molecule B-like [Conger conger]|uniref:repulsive guidance molecule B-like n=1 Tax=Conger conger TaxID=82655 RepID=UPI002A5AF191|nr:repulsive guidance molecule B-like [Conger conger]